MVVKLPLSFGVYILTSSDGRVGFYFPGTHTHKNWLYNFICASLGEQYIHWIFFPSPARSFKCKSWIKNNVWIVIFSNFLICLFVWYIIIIIIIIIINIIIIIITTTITIVFILNFIYTIGTTYN